MSSELGSSTEAEGTLRFGLMWEKQLLVALSAHSAGSRASAWVQGVSPHAGILNLNDTNITAFY